MDLPDRIGWETRLSHKLARLQIEQFKRLQIALGDPPKIQNLPFNFWDGLSAELQGVLQPALEEIYVQISAALTGETVKGIGMDWALVNTRAASWARLYSYELVKGITARTQKAIAEQVEGFYKDQRTLADLETSLARLFSPARAESIAITEVTRAASQGEGDFQDYLRSLGLEVDDIWETSQDDLVCPICGPLDGKKRGDGWTDPPPAHVKCRCRRNTKVRRSA